jgi:hypothetical protein
MRLGNSSSGIHRLVQAVRDVRANSSKPCHNSDAFVGRNKLSTDLPSRSIEAGKILAFGLAVCVGIKIVTAERRLTELLNATNAEFRKDTRRYSKEVTDKVNANLHNLFREHEIREERVLYEAAGCECQLDGCEKTATNEESCC